MSTSIICGSIDWIPSFKVAAAKGDRQCATMRVIGMEDRDAAQLQEVMLTIPSRTQKGTTVLATAGTVRCCPTSSQYLIVCVAVDKFNC